MWLMPTLCQVAKLSRKNDFEWGSKFVRTSALLIVCLQSMTRSFLLILKAPRDVAL
jgi:hypothetical protein